MGSGQLEAGLDQALAAAERLGVRVPQCGRHRAALRLLRRYNDAKRRLDTNDTAALAHIQAAHRTAWEALLILCAAWLQRRRQRSPFTRDKLNLMMGGPEVAEGRLTLARDTQFELYIAALLCLASAEVESGEPDLRFRYGYEMVGVAAKRVRSRSQDQVQRHIAKAVDQIERSGRRGWIAVNLDSRFMSIRLHGGRSKLLDEFERAFDSINPILARHVHNENVLGVMVYGYTSEWRLTEAGQKPALETSAPFRWVAWVTDPGEQLLYKDFSTAWRHRIDSRLQGMAEGRFQCN